MAAIVTAQVRQFRCEVRSCIAALYVDESLAVGDCEARWHVPLSARFYSDGWVYKQGHASALTYCPTHILRVFRCGCWIQPGRTWTRSSCLIHSAGSLVKASAATIELLSAHRQFAGQAQVTVGLDH